MENVKEGNQKQFSLLFIKKIEKLWWSISVLKNDKRRMTFDKPFYLGFISIEFYQSHQYTDFTLTYYKHNLVKMSYFYELWTLILS